ncbi:hypothetical protein ABK040_011030 [Willaertia magna]
MFKSMATSYSMDYGDYMANRKLRKKQIEIQNNNFNNEEFEEQDNRHHHHNNHFEEINVNNNEEEDESNQNDVNEENDDHHLLNVDLEEIEDLFTLKTIINELIQKLIGIKCLLRESESKVREKEEENEKLKQALLLLEKKQFMMAINKNNKEMKEMVVVQEEGNNSYSSVSPGNSPRLVMEEGSNNNVGVSSPNNSPRLTTTKKVVKRIVVNRGASRKGSSVSSILSKQKLLSCSENSQENLDNEISSTSTPETPTSESSSVHQNENQNDEDSQEDIKDNNNNTRSSISEEDEQSIPSAIDTSKDISQLSEEAITKMASRRRKNLQIQRDSPVDEMIITTPTTTTSTLNQLTNPLTTTNLLDEMEFIEIITNPLYQCNDMNHTFIPGIYPNVDPLYNLLTTTSSTTMDLLLLPSVSNTIIQKKVTTNNTTNKGFEKKKPYEYYFSCRVAGSFAPLFTEEYQALCKGFEEPEGPNNLIRDSITGQVKAGTLDKLVLILTSNEEFDNEYMHLFLLTYRSFTTPSELLDKLILRFNTPPPRSCYELELEQLQQQQQNNESKLEREFHTFYKALQAIRLRVGQVLNHWVQSHFFDFREDPDLKRKLQRFIDNDMAGIGMTMLAKTLKSLSDRQSQRRGTFKLQQLEEVKRREETVKNKKLKISTKHFKFRDLYRLTEDNLKTAPLWQLGRRNLCTQLSLINFHLFEKIRPKEFLNQNWMKESRMKKAPNIYAMINRSNEVGMWVATEILMAEDLKERAFILKRFIKLAAKCQKIHNYNTLYDIVAGINSNPIHRLKKTWELVPEKWITKFQELLTLTSPKKSYSALREALEKNADQTVLPYIGMYLTDLLFIEEGNTDFTKEGNLINFSKRRLLGQVILQIQTYQQKAYQFEIIPLLHQRLSKLIYRPMDELYEISCKLEAPPVNNGKKKKKNLAYNLSGGNCNNSGGNNNTLVDSTNSDNTNNNGSNNSLSTLTEENMEMESTLSSPSSSPPNEPTNITDL